MITPRFINWIVEEEGITFEDGVPLTVYSLDYTTDSHVLDELALHIRRHYIMDDELDMAVNLHKMSSEEYLRKYVIPQKEDVKGPTARSADIAEILLSDILEFIHNFTVPRCKQNNRSGKTQSEFGTDVIAYRFKNENKKADIEDELVATEVKAKLTSTGNEVISLAVEDSYKDTFRLAHTLEYYRKKLAMMSRVDQSMEIYRFQRKSDADYQLAYIAAGVSSQEKIVNRTITGITGESLKLRTEQRVFYIHGRKLMELTHAIYERCIR